MSLFLCLFILTYCEAAVHSIILLWFCSLRLWHFINHLLTYLQMLMCIYHTHMHALVFRWHCNSDSTYCSRCYLSMVCPSVCLTHSCSLLRPLYGMRCHLAGTLLWSQATALDGPWSPVGRGGLGVRTPQFTTMPCIAKLLCLLFF